ncbi:MAG: hypothetical protein WBP94_19675 [Rhodomicrobiaceae bacterium]
MITRKIIFRWAALSSVLMLPACYDSPPDPTLAAAPDYSPEYAYVNIVSDTGRQKRVLVPEACLAPATPSAADGGPPHLPPGCANNYNLERMVERKKDLTRGRKLGPAAAAPAARAAQTYIDGAKPPALGGGIREPAGSNSEKTSVEPPQ